jgi:hypothetical protein
MSFAAALQAAKLPKGPQCSVCFLLTSLSPEDAKAFAAALDDPTFPLTGIVRAMEAEKLPRIAQHSLRRHRRRECLRDAV